MQSRICMNMISSSEAVCLVDLERLLPFVDLVKMESRKQRLLRNLDEVILEMSLSRLTVHASLDVLTLAKFFVGC